VVWLSEHQPGNQEVLH